MRPFVSGVRALVLLVSLLLTASGRAEDVAGATAAPWQATITGQIEAFRHQDAPGAFQYAGAGFQVSFPSPEAFFVAIIGSGYAPIMESRSHNFGKFQMLGDKAVVQAVTLIGDDQSLYEAIYQLAEEPAGWRVQGVQLIKQAGMGI